MKQASKPIMQRIHHKLFSFDGNLNDLHVKYQPLDIQSVYRNDATTWRWLAEHDYSIDCHRGLRKLATQIKSSKKMQKLDVEYKNCERISDNSLFYIASSLEKLACLKTFRFSFERCREVSDKGLYHLCEGLKRHPQLQNLSLSFANMMGCITDKGVHWVSKCIKRLPDLKRLELDFTYYVLSDVGLKSMSSSLKSLKKLEVLCLYFTDCRRLTDSGIQNLSEKLKKQSGSLKSLSLKFYSGWFTDIGMKSLQESVERLVLLQKVDLRFRTCPKITNIGLEHVTERLKAMTLLKDITLSFPFRDAITDSNLERFSKVLKGFKNLERLKLDLSETAVTDPGLGFLREIVKRLKTFEAKFGFCPGITDIGLKDLGWRGFVSLQTLAISFWQQHITDTGLSSFSKDLGKLVLLRNLKIEFPFCDRITDKGFIYLCEAFQKLILLQNFELNFRYCLGITGLGVFQLCKVLEVVGSSLKRILWSFSDFDLFSDEELKILYKTLMDNCRSLEKIQVIYNYDGNILLYGKRNIRYAICQLAREMMKGEEKEENVRKKNQQKRLFGCFMKKGDGKSKSSGIRVNNQL